MLYIPHTHAASDQQKAGVLWQRRQVILSREECHCNPLMLLSHPRRVRVSLPALIYSGCRKWRASVSLALLQTSYKCFYNAFTVSARRWHIGNQSPHCDVFPLPFFLNQPEISPPRRGACPTSSPPLSLCFATSSFLSPSPFLFFFPDSSLSLPSCFPLFYPLFHSMLCHKVDCNYCVAVSRMD